MTPTERQGQILTFIVEHVEQHGYQPAVEEMAQALNGTTASIEKDLRKLEKFGAIKIIDRRAIQIAACKFVRQIDPN